jgi:peptidoglycan/LPS O-acetylase OafA/YrhL
LNKFLGRITKNKLSLFTFGKDNNYSIMRAFAASLVLYFHCFHLADGHGDNEYITQFIHVNLGHIGVFIFFVISWFFSDKKLFGS